MESDVKRLGVVRGVGGGRRGRSRVVVEGWRVAVGNVLQGVGRGVGGLKALGSRGWESRGREGDAQG